MSSTRPNHRSSPLHSHSNPQSSNKQKKPVRLTPEALRAHDAIEKPKSSIKRFASNTDPYGRFASTGSSNRRALEVERGLKEQQRGVVFGSNGKGAESSKKSQTKDVKQKDTKQKEGQNNRDQNHWGRDGGWYRG